MIIDIFALVDDSAVILKRPLLPVTPNVYRIPLFVRYDPQILEWPRQSFYFDRHITLNTLLIGGRRFIHTNEALPEIGEFTTYDEDDAVFVVMGLELESLWMYERIEIVAARRGMVSYYGTKNEDGTPNPPMLTNIPSLKKRADALRYAAFSFETIRLNFIKENQSIFIYGGEILITTRCKDNEDNGVRDFFIGRYVTYQVQHDQDNARISGIDWRYFLNVQYPIDTFTKNEFPFLQDEYVDKVKPVMLGIGNGVPGIPTNGLQIYTTFPERIGYYNYQFPPGWINMFRIEVEQEGIWNEIWPGLGNPFNEGTYLPEHPGSTAPLINNVTGVVQVWWQQALQGGEYGNDPNKIRMFARWPHTTMQSIITSLLDFSGDASLSYGFSGEFAGLAEMGLYLDKAAPIFTWIEKAQSANILGGQLIVKDDAFYFRLENPNRVSALEIPASHVLNHETLPVSIADDFMFSGWNITYQKSWADDDNSKGHIIGNTGRFPIAGIYSNNDLTAQFVYNDERPEASTFDLSSIQQRVRILRDVISTFRHKIVNLTLPMYFEYMELLVYDIVTYMPIVLKETGRSHYDWIIYQKNIDLTNETITLSLIERVKSEHWNDGFQ